MAVPGKYAMNIYRGDSVRWQFRLWMDAGKTQPADLTGVTVKAEIRDKPKGTKITPVDCTVTLPNIIDGHLTAPVSKDMTIDKGQWDLQLTYPSGDVATVVAGDVTVIADITDSG